ncbi:unnamed protein product [Mesocestoides corti]|uniref:receptor protein-tyrosine kinase n=1 Tax=Mesocestoides corti TaxID=53468 RepID=A0A0R3UPM3_MESCO|nr:unnamed protein product [Mesocestoides corti]
MVAATSAASPASVTVTPTSTTSLFVRFKTPTDATGISRYEVTVDRVIPKQLCTIPLGDKLECQLKGLQPAARYTVTVSACVRRTNPTVCSEGVRVSGWTKPLPPLDVAVVPSSNTSVVVRFEAPTDARGIGRYEVAVSGAEPIKSCTIPRGEKLECRVDGLQSASKFEGAVKSCINDTDPAVCSEDVVASGWTKPNAPRQMTFGSVDSASVYVSWQKPDGKMDGITLYKALARQSSRAVERTQEHSCFADASLEELGCSISGLSPSTTYTVSVSSCIATTLCGDEVGLMEITTLSQPVNIVPIIVGVVVALAVLVVVLVFVVYKRRRTNRKPTPLEYLEETSKDELV